MESAISVVFRRTNELVPYANNARTHSSEQVAQIAASIREFGFTNPILISPSNDIIAGHGRWDAAKLLNLDEVPCIELGHLTPIQRRAYVLADNKIALNAGWNTEMLSVELAQLDVAGFDLSIVGFSGDELSDLGLGNEEEPEPEPEKTKPQYCCVIVCEGEPDQRTTLDELVVLGYMPLACTMDSVRLKTQTSPRNCSNGR